MGRIKDMTGKRIGKIIVIGRDKTRGHGAMWHCRCDCGSIFSTRGNHLRKKNPTESCGCINYGGEKHGHTKSYKQSKTYKTWLSMKSRCFNKNTISWHNYGGRGITVCKKWTTSFESFLKDMGEKPEGKSLERINVNGDYKPSNCKWATNVEQGNNRRNNSIIFYKGESKTVTEWSRITGIQRSSIYSRLRNNWDIEKALTTKPIKKGSPKIKSRKTYTFNEKTQNLARWSEELGIKEFNLRNRIEVIGWSIEKAFKTPVRKHIDS